MLEQARAADATAPVGPLHGVPVGLKDIIDAYGMPTRFNSSIYPDYWPDADSACAALIRQAGAIIMGKTATTEFANRHPGPCRNPLDLARTPGGSSSGSAAGVADHQVSLSLGTQTSGSIIRPAAFCGIVGFKPSFGEISRVGVKQQSGSLDTLGLCARSVSDIGLLQSVLTWQPYQAVVASGFKLRIKLCRPPEWEQASAESRKAVEAAASALEQAGATLDELVLPPALFDDWQTQHRRIANFESARNFAFEKSRHREKLSKALYEGRIRDGEACTLEQYVAVQRKADAMRSWYDEAIADVDAVVTLSSAGEAPLGLEGTGTATFNSLWTLLYAPCITLPAGLGPAGMPLAVQLVGRRFADEALLGVAAAVEQMPKAS